jgi:hypothetical protein
LMGSWESLVIIRVASRNGRYRLALPYSHIANDPVDTIFDSSNVFQILFSYSDCLLHRILMFHLFRRLLMAWFSIVVEHVFLPFKNWRQRQRFLL